MYDRGWHCGDMVVLPTKLFLIARTEKFVILCSVSEIETPKMKNGLAI